MRALVKTQKGDGFLEVREMEKPAVQNADDVLIRIAAAGVCGTDLHILHDEFPCWPPVILGHEFSGTVVEVGSAVTRFAPGDRVVGEPHTRFCGKCVLCRAGNIQLCAEKRSPGWGINGAFTSYIVMPELFLHMVPAGLSDEVAALAEPAAIVVHGLLERGGMQACENVAIVGAGPIALLSVVVARAAGARAVYVLGTDADEALRFPVATRLGADAIFNVQRSDAVMCVLEATGGIGVDTVVEASGAAPGIDLAAAVVKKRGHMTVLGLPGNAQVPVRWADMVRKVLDVAFCFSSSVSAWEKALTILARSPVDLSCLISHRAAIEDWRQVFEDCETGRAVKALFIPPSIINK